MKRRIRRNRVHLLKLEPGIWCTDEDKLKKEAKGFFGKLYSSEIGNGDVWHLRGSFPNLDILDIKMLAKEVEGTSQSQPRN